MEELKIKEIKIAAIGYLENWLKEHGYTDIIINEWHPGSVDILANGIKENIVVHLKTVLQPDEQIVLNGTDKFALIDLALRLDRKAYVAYLSIDEENNIIGQINWERLSK